LGKAGNLSRHAGTIQRIDEFDKLFAGLFVDVGKLDTHPREEQMPFWLISGPGDLSFGFVFFPRMIGQCKFD
jgi:hypothetical protein